MGMKPKEGDRVLVSTPDGDLEGTVLALLSSQFTFIDTEGQHRYCMYSSPWRANPEEKADE